MLLQKPSPLLGIISKLFPEIQKWEAPFIPHAKNICAYIEAPESWMAFQFQRYTFFLGIAQITFEPPPAPPPSENETEKVCPAPNLIIPK